MRKHVLLMCAALLATSLFACGKNNDENNTTTPSTTPDMASPEEDMSESTEDMTSGQDMGGEDMGEEGSDMADMPPEQMGLRIEGLSAPVTVNFDAMGVLHLRCQTNNDCYAAQGYYHAAHRFAQMDLRRRLGRGRLSSLVAVKYDDAINIDIETRKLLSTRDGEFLEEKLYADLDDETRGAVDAYTRGVNAWLADLEEDRNGATLSEEYDYALINARNIPAWEPQDSIAVGLLFLNSLMDIASSELSAASAVANLPTTFAQDLYLGDHLDADSPIITSAGESYTSLGSLTGVKPLPRALDLTRVQPELVRAKGAIDEAHARLEGVRKMRGEGPFGSNSWATAPALNEEDHAILSNDPHLALTNPALWYLAEIDAVTEGTGDFHAAGVSFAGLPGIMIGHSEEVAWSATVAYWDLVDVYIEELSASGDGVMRDGAEVQFIEKNFTVTHASGTQDEVLLFVPGHGPVLSIDEEAGTAVTLKSVLADSDLDLKLFLNMGRMKSMSEAKELLSGSTAAGFNFVLIDRQGNISYYPFAGVPRREWDVTAAPAWLPLPGNGEYEWSEGLIKADELPQLENPSNNFIATANAAITDDMLDGIPGNEGYPPLQTVYMAPGARQARIVDLLQDSQMHTAETHSFIQGDNHSWIAEQMVPGLLTAADEATLSPRATDLLAALRAWDYTCPTGLDGSDPMTAGKLEGPEAEASIGCAAFHVVLYTVADKILEDEFDAAAAMAGVGVPRSSRGEFRVLYWLLVDPEMLDGGESYWDDVSTEGVETRAETLAAALDLAAQNIEEVFGSATPDDWRWGRVHTLTLSADLLSALTGDFDNGPNAAPGGLFTVNVANPSGGDGTGSYTFGSGPSMRMVVEGKAEGFTSSFNFPGGQVHHRDSPFYDHLLGDWLTNTSFEMPFTVEQVDAASMQSETIEPAQ
jgi:penicillin amidase